MGDERAKINDEPFDSFVGCAKTLLALASGLGLLGWVYVAIVTLAWYGFPRTLLDAFVVFYPFIYLSAAIYCCWVNILQRKLYFIAILLNLPLAAISIYWVIESGSFPPGILICLLFIVLWVLLCVAKRYDDNNAAAQQLIQPERRLNHCYQT